MSPNFQFILPELILLGCATISFMGSAFFKNKKILDVIFLLGIVLAAIALPCSFKAGSGATFFGMLINDGYTVFFKTVVLGMLAAVGLFSVSYSEIEAGDKGEYYFFLLSLTVSIMFAVSATNLVMVYLALEGVSLISYILAGYLKRDIFSSEAGIKYFLFGALSTGIALYGISLIYGLFGTLDLAAIVHTLQQATAYQPLLLVAVLLVLVGLGFKCSLVPFHMWTPDVYEGAPTPVAAFFSVAPKAMGFALLIRIFLQYFGIMIDQWTFIAVIMAMLTMTIGNVLALQQNNIKRLLAYSTIAQAGYMLAAVALGTPAGIKAALFYIFIYGWVNLGAFGAVIAISNRLHATSVDSYAGLYKRDPFGAFVLAACLLSLAGLPPLAGFMAKFFLLVAVVEVQQIALAVVIAINSVIGLFYYTRVIRSMFFAEAAGSTLAPSSLLTQIILFIILVGNFVLGVWPYPILKWLTSLRIF